MDYSNALLHHSHLKGHPASRKMQPPLIYTEPSKVRGLGFRKEYLNTPAPLCYERCVTIMSKWGIVIVEDLEWQNNFGVSRFCYFSTIKFGIMYSASIDKGRLSDWQIKRYAGIFIREITQRIKSQRA